MKLTWRRVPLAPARAFTISAGTTTSFTSLVAEIEHDGIVGYGEAAPSRRVTGETLDTVEAFLSWAAKELPPFPDDLQEFLRHAHDDICGNPGARAALDIAVHDWLGKAEGKPARDLHGIPAGRIRTSMTVSLAEPAAMAEEALDYASRGFSVLKLKLGDAAHDVERVAAVRRAVPGARLFVDANQAWTVDTARRLAPLLKDLGVAFLEQPVRANDDAGLVALSRDCALPVVADEAIHDRHDVERLVGLGYRGGVNVKLQKAGGIAPAVGALRLARRHGLATMCGCNLETSVGIGAALQLVAMLDEADLDGNLLLAADPFATARPRDGWLASPDLPGIGAVPVDGRWPPTAEAGDAVDQL